MTGIRAVLIFADEPPPEGYSYKLNSLRYGDGGGVPPVDGECRRWVVVRCWTRRGARRICVRLSGCSP